MSRSGDPFKTLGVDPDAPEEVIKAAHKALARKHHRDATGAADDEEMKRVNDAFEKIKNGEVVVVREEREAEPEEDDDDGVSVVVDGENDSGGCTGCLTTIGVVVLLWALVFGVTIGGKHYGFSGCSSCSCNEGVVFDWGEPVDAGDEN